MTRLRWQDVTAGEAWWQMNAMAQGRMIVMPFQVGYAWMPSRLIVLGLRAPETLEKLPGFYRRELLIGLSLPKQVRFLRCER